MIFKYFISWGFSLQDSNSTACRSIIMVRLDEESDVPFQPAVSVASHLPTDPFPGLWFGQIQGLYMVQSPLGGADVGVVDALWYMFPQQYTDRYMVDLDVPIIMRRQYAPTSQDFGEHGSLVLASEVLPLNAGLAPFGRTKWAVLHHVPKFYNLYRARVGGA